MILTRLFAPLAIALLLFSGCARQEAQKKECPVLTTINLVDRNGMQETISSKDRIKQYQTVDYLSPQPYQKVLRVYSRDAKGDISAIITSYHANGQVKQCLDIVNNRAYGKYREWYANGCLKIEANVIGGNPDLNPGSEKTWLFDGQTYAWNDQGQLEAEIPYARGQLEGLSIYYRPSGLVWKKEPYCANKLEGTFQIFYESGNLLQETQFIQGVKCGSSYRYWDNGELCADEEFVDGLLMEADYFNPCSDEPIADIRRGTGWRAVFGKESLIELHEYRQGKPEGEVRLFGKNGQIARIYHVKDGAKNGEDIIYREQSAQGGAPQPKLSMAWVNGIIQGTVKTWYENGRLESQREMSDNLKNGMLTAWYPDGSVMMIEEYDHDKLVKGEYFRITEKFPVSTIGGGKGIATIFDIDGTFIRKITYLNGKPVD
jgi:antitoxin component YwqK of YwqJK toxin-antitoxin module